MIVVKVNASFEKKSTNSYSNFKKYESADFNEPYVAAVFNSSFVSDGFSNFPLGKMITNDVILFWVFLPPFSLRNSVFMKIFSRFQIN